jgi:TRAP-type C4-dicarboxylate transport system substrate-binding protein
MNKVVEQNILAPIADEVAAKAEVVLIGYSGGGIRNIFANKPLKNLADLKGLKVRVQGAPIWSKTFAAVGMSPTVIAYNEVYNAIQNGVISAGENEAAGVEAMKFYEVAPHLAMTEHAITIRPICFSTKTFKSLPKDLQDAIVKAGKEAGAYGRQVESSEDTAKLDALEKAGKLKRVPFADREAMKKMVDPVMAAYAKEIGAEKIFAAITDMK